MDRPAPASDRLLELHEISKWYGDHQVLAAVSFSVGERERVCILGPSGCGKTTTLNIIGGFLPADQGLIRLSGRVVNLDPPHKRATATVFQDYALFPHLSVAENILFGLRVRKILREDLVARLSWALDLTRLRGFEGRFPRQLSGGQRQRVALARALVVRPELLLLDEPLSNLDANLRVEMRRELLRIQRETGVASILVTHDQNEAFVLAEKIILMYAGRIVQEGTPHQLYTEPQTEFAARFVGFENILRVTIRSPRGDYVLPNVEGTGFLESGSTLTGEVSIAFRAESVRLNQAGVESGGHFRGVISEVEYTGEDSTYSVQVGAVTIIARRPENQWPFRRGEQVMVGWDPASVRVFRG